MRIYLIISVLYCLLLASCGAGNNNQPQLQYPISKPVYKYIAVGESATILASMDGIEWKNATLNSSNQGTLKSVAHNSRFFVSVGDNSSIVFSIDGINWSNVSRLNQEKIDFTQIIATDESKNFIAVGNGGYAEIKCSYLGTLSYNCFALSINFLIDSQTKLNGLIFDGTHLVAAGNDDLGSVISKYSKNNFTWSLDNKLKFRESVYSLFYDSGMYLITADNNNIIATDYQFESMQSYTNNLSIRQVAKLGNQYIGITTTDMIAISNNLSIWQTFDESLPFVPNYINTNESQLLFVGNGGSILLMDESRNIISNQIVGTKNLTSALIF